MVWEASQKGVPFLGVPGNSLNDGECYKESRSFFCCVFGGIRFVLDVGELHAKTYPINKLVCWFYSPNIQRKNQANQP